MKARYTPCQDLHIAVFIRLSCFDWARHKTVVGRLCRNIRESGVTVLKCVTERFFCVFAVRTVHE
ncbi:hypothetical protein ACER0C_002201 [Sarotherodon galilaeus]